MDAMPVKKSKSAKPKSGAKKKSGKKSGRKTKSAPAGTIRDGVDENKVVDMMNPHAMENLYYIAHGAREALELRGFAWPDVPKGKKKKKGKKK